MTNEKRSEKRNFDILRDGTLNKGVAFSLQEREEFGLRGLLPHSVAEQDIQVSRVMESLDRKDSDIERYILLSSLMNRNEKLFFRVVTEYVEKLVPLIYTPTVGQACKEFSHIFRQSNGFYITPDDRGEITHILGNWPRKDVRVIVVTDGQRILGLGDLGANGMGIPIGKLALYSACAGIHPDQCLPVMLDVGTNNQELLDDPFYVGYPHARMQGEAYDELVDEFVMAIQKLYPDALIQFEDFLTPNAYKLLHKYRDRVLCFNDDIQGTAAVTLAGVLASSRITGKPLEELKVMFLGAGAAATGIADLMVSAMHEAGLSKEDAYTHFWFVDSKGLVVSSRQDLAEHKIPYAQDYEQLGLLEAIDSIRPDVLIGATGSAGTFTREVVELMSAINERPVIFALSNPTSRTECTAEQAYNWSDGRAVFASGSPFEPVAYNGTQFVPAQSNNVYVFPGIGLGAITTNASSIPDDLFLTAAQTLAGMVTEGDLDQGSLFPRLTGIRRISRDIAVAVSEKVYELGLERIVRPSDLEKTITDYMFDPHY